MTREEMLELQSMIETVVNSSLDTKLEPIKNNIAEVKEKVDAVDTRLRKLEIKVEHKIDSALKATMEGLAGVTENMHSALNVENRVETLEHKTSAIEFYIKKQQQQ
ncbi:MAG: hypothetical protein FWF88_08005 [Peptococcaceae bacterium]|nr:hypothetical protein [Peptococcaceae bacterium]